MYTIIANSKKRKKALPDYSELKLGNTTYYNFDETTGTVSYDSVGSNNTTSSGLDLGVTGLIDKGVSSTGGGSSKYLKIPKAAINQNAMYISTWFYAESDSSLNIINRNVNGFTINILGNTDEIGVTYFGVADLGLESADLIFNDWNHIVIEKTGGAMKIYINNVLKYDKSNSYSDSTNDIFIGVALSSNGSVTVSYKFKIDELGIWDRPLTSDERTQLYNNGNGIQLYEYDPLLPIKADNIAYYNFGEPSGTKSYDSVGNNTATASGLDLGTSGLIGKGISSTGGGTRYLLIPKAVINQNALYISTWYYAESDSSFNITSRVNTSGYVINVIGSSDIISVTYFGKINFPEVSADLIFNEWNHIVIEKTDLTTKVYINNVLKFNNSHPSYAISTIDTFIGVGISNIGGVDTSYKFKIDELGIWNRPLTSDERTILYNSGNGIQLYDYDPYLPLKIGNTSFFKLDETTGTILYNETGGTSITQSNVTLGDTGLIGNAVSADGSLNSYIKIPTEVLNQNASFVSVWFYFEGNSLFTLGNRKDNLTTQGGVTWQIGYFSPTYPNTISVTYSNVAELPPINANLIQNDWNHIYIDKRDSRTTIYINNVLKSTQTNTYLDSPNDFYLGTGLNTNGTVNTASKIKYKIDELGIWNRLLTPAERYQLYNSGNGINLYP